MVFDIAISKTLGPRVLQCHLRSNALITAITGPSGYGKTTVLNMVSGIVKPDSGHITISGKPLFDAAKGFNLPPEDRRAGYVFQNNRLFPHLSVRKNLTYGTAKSAPLLSFDETVEFLGISDLLERRTTSLSGGEARRVSIGRALLMAPDFLLLDEPLTSLDAKRREDMLHIIERIRDEVRLPILYVSHHADEVARLAGDIHDISSDEPDT